LLDDLQILSSKIRRIFEEHVETLFLLIWFI
jgi:hypothetical protein